MSKTRFGHRHVAAAAALLVLAGGATRLHAHEINLKDLQIVHPNTVEPADPKVKDVAISMTIHNHGTSADRLLTASSPLAEKAEIHTPASDNGGAEPVIDVPAGGTVKLTSQGPHVMLRGLTEALTGYEMFPLWLTFEKAGKVEVEVMVEENDADLTGHEADHGHGKEGNKK